MRCIHEILGSPDGKKYWDKYGRRCRKTAERVICYDIGKYTWKKKYPYVVIDGKQCFPLCSKHGMALSTEAISLDVITAGVVQKTWRD